MSERTLRHVVAQHLTDFLQDWYEQAADGGRPPTERDFAAWLAGRAHSAAAAPSAI